MSILIVDFGSQYTHLISRCLSARIGVSTVLVPYLEVRQTMHFENIKGIVLSGGPKSVNELHSNQDLKDWFTIEILQKHIPVLGICFGLQWLANYFGGNDSVDRAESGEFGSTELFTSDSWLIQESLSIVWMSHQDNVTSMPEEFQVTGWTKTCPFAMVENMQRQIFGCQFHPEVEHTKHGQEIYRKFAIDVCGCPVITQQDALEIIKLEVHNQLVCGQDAGGKILLALSGGVDSTVLCYLFERLLPNRVVCVFVNNGLLRKGEAKAIRQRFAFLGDRFICIDAKAKFIGSLVGVSDPETKRKIIGKCFVECFQNIQMEFEWLAQGTIYPDVIESCGLNGTAKVIKSHHNVGGLPATLKLKLLEPLKFLFKDQVRDIGTTLGISPEFVHRHPFPGPGLGIRVVGEVTKDLLKIVKQADKIFLDLLHTNGLYYETSQAYAALLPVKTVGVVGDNRRYGYIITLRAVKTGDFMTASVSDFGLPFLSQVATNIINSCPDVARVVYDVTTKPPGTIEME